jgi:myo-inositol-1(or 4)-monophosphatase
LSDINNINIAKCLALANDGALKAGAALTKNKVVWNLIIHDSERDKKLKADIESEKILLHHFLNNSDFPVLTEETGWHHLGGKSINEIESGIFWIIDPLDGTINYSMNIPLCCVSVALICNRKPVLGAIYDFERAELFSGGLGLGVKMNGQIIKVSEKIKKSESILMTGFPKARDFSERGMTRFGIAAADWRKVRMLGSASLSMAYVAAGRADAYEEESIMSWDVSAGWALIELAGGRVEAQMESFRSPLNVCATNGHLK